MEKAQAQRRMNPFYRSKEWRKLSAQLLARHRRDYGDLCPGWKRSAHYAPDLTCDHIRPLARGGPPLDEENLQVLCRACNGRKAHQEGYA